MGIRDEAAIRVANIEATIGTREEFFETNLQRHDGYETMRLVDLGRGHYETAIPPDWDPLQVWNFTLKRELARAKAASKKAGTTVKPMGPVEFAAKTLGISTQKARTLEYLAARVSQEKSKPMLRLSGESYIASRGQKTLPLTAKNVDLFVQYRGLQSDKLREHLVLEAGQRAVVLPMRDGEVLRLPTKDGKRTKEQIYNLTGYGQLRHHKNFPDYLGGGGRKWEVEDTGGSPGLESGEEDDNFVTSIRVKVTTGSRRLTRMTPSLKEKLQDKAFDLRKDWNAYARSTRTREDIARKNLKKAKTPAKKSTKKGKKP